MKNSIVKKLLKDAAGTVIDFDSECVFCKMQTKTLPIEIELPWSLFPNGVHLGAKIKIHIGKNIGKSTWIEILKENTEINKTFFYN
jgi:hypothetical protein